MATFGYWENTWRGSVYPQKRSLGNVASSAGVVVLSVLCKSLGWFRLQYSRVSMFVGRECGNIKAKCGGTALACKPKVHKARSPNPLLQSKNGNSLNCPCFSVHAFFALFTGCHWDWMYSTTFLFLVFLCCLIVFLSLGKPVHCECRGERVGQRKQSIGVLLLLKPYNHQDIFCNYPKSSVALGMPASACLLCYVQYLISYCFTLMKEVLLSMTEIFTASFL